MPLFCILARDKQDAEAPARRQAARLAHFCRTKQAVEQGQVTFAGSMLGPDGNMRLSVLIVDFPSQEELDRWLTEEPYLLNGAWDHVETAPLFVAVQGNRITQQWLELMEPILEKGRMNLTLVGEGPRGQVSQG